MKWKNKLGLGSVQFGIPYGISNETGQTPIEEVAKILDLAFENEIRIIDTASAYGTSESVIGLLNANRFSIVSKFGPSSSVEDIKMQLENSLLQLNAESLYGYLAHRPLDLLDNIVIWKKLQKLKTENKIKKIGFSLNSPDEYYQLKSAGISPDLVQVPFNYFDTRFKEVLIELKENGCEIHTRSTFLQGLFFTDTEKISSYFDELKPKLREIQNINKDKLQGALLAYVLKQEFIDVVVIGVENSLQLNANLKSIAIAPQLEIMEKSFSEKLIMPMYWPKV